MTATEPTATEPTSTAPPELTRDAAWQRLDPRMLLVHPIRELIRFLPVLVAVVVAGASGSGEAWQLLGVAVPVGLGLLRYLTTSFRIHAGRVELRHGLVNRHVLATRIDRVRTVDLTSPVIHRALGLTRVRIGTGVTVGDDDEKLDLDGLPLDRARELRQELLRVTDTTEGQTRASEPVAGAEVVRLEPGWVRFAPFTGSGLVIAAAAVGALSQALNTFRAWDRLDASSVADRGSALPLPVLIGVSVLLAVAVLSLLAVGGYLVSNWGFRLTRGPGRDAGTWHLTRGLLTTRETTLDDDRVAGVTVVEPLGLRLVRGARLFAIVTGLDRKQRGSSALVPPAPRAVVDRVAAAILDTDHPVLTPLVGHGPRAVRRRWVRALVPAAVVAAACVTGVATGIGTWLLVGLLGVPLAALLAADRVHSLGHALAASHLVVRSGSLVRRRRALAVEHVIGWNLRASFFQRRAGLVTLVATTAGGPQSVPVPDVPEQDAVRLAALAVPGLVEQFYDGRRQQGPAHAPAQTVTAQPARRPRPSGGSAPPPAPTPRDHGAAGPG